MKIASLNLKIIIKLCDIYTNNLDNCHEKLLELLIVLSGFLCPPLQVIHFNNKLIESVQVYLTAGTAPVLGHVIQDQQFVQIYFKNISSYLNNYETKLGSILLSASIMLKIIPLNSEIKNYWFGNEECNLVYKMFFFINKSHLELMLNLEINIPCLPGKPSRKSSLYEYLMLHTAAVVVNLNCKQFIYIEKILLKSILQTDVWQAMFAADIWSIASRYGSAELCFNQLELLFQIHEKLRKCQNRPENVYLNEILRRLFSFLNMKKQLLLLNTYKITTHPKLWKIVQLFQYTNLQQDFQNDIKELNQVTNNMIESFITEKYTMEEFNKMCDFLDLVSVYPNEECDELSLKVLSRNVCQLWQFNSNSLCTSSNWFQTFTRTRCRVTKNIITYLNPSELLQILNSIRSLQHSNAEYKLIIIKILKALSKVQMDESSVKSELFNLIDELFKCVLKDKNTIVKQKSMETFDYFAHHTSHVEILSGIVESESQLQDGLSNYLQKVIEKTNSVNVYLNWYNLIAFEHICDVNLSCVEHHKKKIKLTDINIDSVLQSLEFDSNTLVEYCNKSHLPSDSRNTLEHIVTKLNMLL